MFKNYFLLVPLRKAWSEKNFLLDILLAGTEFWCFKSDFLKSKSKSKVCGGVGNYLYLTWDNKKYRYVKMKWKQKIEIQFKQSMHNRIGRLSFDFIIVIIIFNKCLFLKMLWSEIVSVTFLLNFLILKLLLGGMPPQLTIYTR